RRLKRPVDGVGGDLVELDPLRIAELENLGQVPGDRLPLTVGVGGQDHLLILPGRRAQLVDRLAAAFHHLVARLRAVLHVPRDLLFGQVGDVAHGGADVETVPQEPLQRPGLGRRLDDDQTFWHSFLYSPSRAVVLGRRLSGRESYARSLPRRNAFTYPPWCLLTAPSSSREVRRPSTSAIGSCSFRLSSAAFTTTPSERRETMPSPPPA